MLRRVTRNPVHERFGTLYERLNGEKISCAYEKMLDVYGKLFNIMGAGLNLR